MSTLKVATIQDTSGNNSSTPEQVFQGRAKAWVNFNGTGTPAIRDSFNVSSITDNNQGDFSVNFTTAMANANYAASLATGDTDDYDRFASIHSYTSSSLRMFTINNDSDVLRDTDNNHVIVFGD
tara:strand:- start:639 stop:1010 length:372 start_codon:yes stop_codon:yes gene_type:complete